MSYEEIAREALERAEKATKGRWRLFEGDSTIEIKAPGDKVLIHWRGFDATDLPKKASANAEFIAHARQDVPDLARAVLEQRQEIERLKSERDNELAALLKRSKEREVCLERLESELRIEKASQATRGNN